MRLHEKVFLGDIHATQNTHLTPTQNMYEKNKINIKITYMQRFH